MRSKLSISPGDRFGRLTVIEEVDKVSSMRYFSCVCECGSVKKYRLGKLTTGHTKSCGCYRIQQISKSKTKSVTVRKHDLYFTWASMKDRCYCKGNTNYPDYGGRGIGVCDRWRKSFECFVSDVGTRPSSKHTLDRIDVNGDYEPSNTKWSTPSEQARNRRSNRNIVFMGKSKCISEWADVLGIKRHVLRHKIETIGDNQALEYFFEKIK